MKKQILDGTVNKFSLTLDCLKDFRILRNFVNLLNYSLV